MHFVGIDWASEEHAVCVIDLTGQVEREFVIPHAAEGFATLHRRLGEVGKPEDLMVGIERPSGVLVDELVAGGYRVVPVHPNVVKACRPRYGSALAKSDGKDAFIIADVLRTDGHRFRPLSGASDEVRAIRAMVRAREDLVAQRVAVASQLSSLLGTFWPGAAVAFHEIHSKIACAFVDKYPTPASASELTEEEFGEFLRKNSYSGSWAPADFVKRLRQAPTGRCGPLEVEAKAKLAQCLAGIVQQLVSAERALSKRIRVAVKASQEGALLLSLPRMGGVTAGVVLSELRGEGDGFHSDEQLAAQAGVAPVTRASGKSRTVGFRIACNTRLRQALVTFAGNSRFVSRWADDVYRRARARGCTHQHATRVLARSWVRVLWAVWTKGVPYDPAKHRAAAALAA